jgi:hypothetical protein
MVPGAAALALTHDFVLRSALAQLLTRSPFA